MGVGMDFVFFYFFWWLGVGKEGFWGSFLIWVDLKNESTENPVCGVDTMVLRCCCAGFRRQVPKTWDVRLMKCTPASWGPYQHICRVGQFLCKSTKSQHDLSRMLEASPCIKQVMPPMMNNFAFQKDFQLYLLVDIYMPWSKMVPPTAWVHIANVKISWKGWAVPQVAGIKPWPDP